MAVSAKPGIVNSGVPTPNDTVQPAPPPAGTTSPNQGTATPYSTDTVSPKPAQPLAPSAPGNSPIGPKPAQPVGNPTGTPGMPTGAPGMPVPGGPSTGSQTPPSTPSAPPTGPGTTQAPMPGAPSSADFNPVMGQVDAAHTVQGELGDILKNGNPLLEGAKARAMQAANARGLQNSSMAAQSGEEAIVNSALPIAQADSAAYQKQQLTNQDIANQFLSQKEGAKLDLEKAYAAFQQNNYMFDKDASLKRYINDSGISSNEKIAALQTEAQKSIANSQIQASKDNTAATIASNEKINSNLLDERLKEAGMNIDATTARDMANFSHQDKVNLLNLDANTFNQYTTQLNTIETSQMEPEDKQKAINNLNAIYAGRLNEAKTYTDNTTHYPNTPAGDKPNNTTQPGNGNGTGSGSGDGGDGGGGDGGGGGTGGNGGGGGAGNGY